MPKTQEAIGTLFDVDHLKAAAGAAVASAGAIMGLLIHKSDSEFLDEHVDAGHLLLFVRTNETARGDKAVQILSEHGAYQPKVYTVEASR